MAARRASTKKVTEFVTVPAVAGSEQVDLAGESLFKTKAKDAKTLVDFLGAINIDSKTPHVRMTPIICTIGLASRENPVLGQLLDAGMNVARLNLSHGTHAFHAETIENIHKVLDEHSRKLGVTYPLAIAVDLKGPKIQTGYFEGGATVEVELKRGAMIRLTTDKAYEEKGTHDHIYVDYHGITKVAKVGGKVFLDHGMLSMKIVDLGLSFLTCVVENGGTLGGQRAVHLPETTVDLPALTTKDRLDLQFAAQQEVDIIFAPYVRHSSTIGEIRFLLGERGRRMLIFAKIETRVGATHFNDIMNAADGIIISRADLSTDMAPEAVITVQKTIVARCNLASKPVICSTQVLETMTRRTRPRIAEVQDIGNAILNGTDCFLLSGETETGAHPVEAMRTLVAASQTAEAALWTQQRFDELSHLADETDAQGVDIVAMATVRASILCRAAAIIVITKSGGSAVTIAKFRPRCPIIAVTRYLEVARKHQVFRGIMPVVFTDKPNPEWSRDVDERVHFGMRYGLQRGFVKIGDHVIIVSGWKKGSLFTNTMRVVYVSTKRALQEVWDN